VAEPLCPDIPDQSKLRQEPRTQTVEEYAEWLVDLEAIFGRDDRSRPPMTGRFLL